MRKRLICIFLVLCMALGVVACGGGSGNTDKDEKATLSAPTNLRIIEQNNSAVARWDAVANADGYIVTVNDVMNTTSETTYTLGGLLSDYSVSVVARASGYKNSSAATTSYSKPAVTVSISGSSECHSSGTVQLTATVVNAPADNNGVSWRITTGSEYASINADGLVLASNVDGDKIIVVTATSLYDNTAVATKAITISARPELTQAMLDELNVDKIAFEGFLEVQQWTVAGDYMAAQTTLNTRALIDEDRWYGEYQDLSGLTRFAYFEDNGGIAYSSSVDLMNNFKSTPLVDPDGNQIAWADTNYKNNMRDLTVADFMFNEKTWRWEYKRGTAAEKEAKMRSIIASAHLFDIKPKTLSLIVDDDEVAGLYIESKDDNLMYAGSVVRMYLTAAVNIGESVTVPVVSAYAHESMHDDLQAAIDKMKALTSYTTECLDSGTSAVDSSTSYDGYVETVTPDACYMRTYDFNPFQSTLIEIGEGTHNYNGNDFGYVKISDDTYNSFKVVGGAYSVDREFSGDFRSAMPSFEFAAEIFTAMKENADGSKTYYVDTPMLNVATTLYKGLGNDQSFYGIFANSTYRSRAFVPYVTVNADGYISSASFSYYTSSVHGEIKLAYRDFDSATLDNSITAKLDAIKNNPRVAPDAWNDITINVPRENRVSQAGEYLISLFDESITERLPYFGAAVGDTFNEGEVSFRSITVNGKRVSVGTIILFFEVPIDINYSIDSSLQKMNALLVDNSFATTDGSIYTNDNISVEVKEDQMRLFIYIWNNSPSTAQ